MPNFKSIRKSLLSLKKKCSPYPFYFCCFCKTSLPHPFSFLLFWKSFTISLGTTGLVSVFSNHQPLVGKRIFNNACTFDKEFPISFSAIESSKHQTDQCYLDTLLIDAVMFQYLFFQNKFPISYWQLWLFASKTSKSQGLSRYLAYLFRPAPVQNWQQCVDKFWKCWHFLWIFVVA